MKTEVKQQEMKEQNSSELSGMTSRLIWATIIGIGIPILATATGFILKIQFTPIIWFIIAFWFLAGVGATIYTATDSVYSFGREAINICKRKHNRKRHKSEIELADEFGRMYLKVDKERTTVYFAIKAVLEEEPVPANAVLAFETAVEQELGWMTEIPTHANAQKFFPGLVGEKSYYGSSRVHYMKVSHLAPDLKNMREKLLVKLLTKFGRGGLTVTPSFFSNN